MICVIPSLVLAQDTIRSSAYKSQDRRPAVIKIVRPSDVTYQLWEGFTLMRNANSGDPAAQHELGLRYLTGQGFTPDTVKAFQLIQRASEQHHLLAHFNLGVFYHNGWGTEWNPFEAYKHFRYAAQHDMREGAYAFGLYFTDNLTVRRNWNEAYKWIKRSAENGFALAKEVLPDIERYASAEHSDSSTTVSAAPSQPVAASFEPVMLDFSDAIEEVVDEHVVLVDILRALGTKWQNRIKELPIQSMLRIVTDSILFTLLVKHAEWGVPEEYTVLGRCYEKGLGVTPDSISAVLSYLRAVRLESRRAPNLLIRLIENGTLITKLQHRASRGDADAQYAISCFALTEIFPMQKKEDIVLYLQKAAQQLHVPSMVELGTAYFNGQLVPQQKEKGMELWTKASALGNREALVRLASAKILTGSGPMSADSAMRVLRQAVDEESLLAQVTLGFCYEKGILVQKKNAEAVRYYRSASQRGSRTAYLALQRMYDSIRPREKEFQIDIQ